ncbi:hypothetical protein [Ferribacterium limneticum]|uniref:hypothetical protein n=1 Tax=Ferribacterium limneticum TaxID=76259 RepID=UPI001CF87812|nr:hypothetical protein [Ferribacterium limneticum]UCV26767.1 hypothetical protein KI617_10640 [Ferribacterium limneticum]UCV30684.1 hypothetical protein KI608_10640 [Ferribacterium limneticum]
MQIDINKKYRTRDGHPVRILCCDKLGDCFPVVALISYPKGHEETNLYTLNGRYNSVGTDQRDLIEVSPYEDFVIDEPVMVRHSASDPWRRRHFAGVSEAGSPISWSDGQTSFTSSTKLAWTECRRPTPEELANKL